MIPSVSHADTWDRLLPIGTLLLGTALARYGQRGDARIRASEELAGLIRQVWTKGGDTDWIDLQVHLGQLAVALRVAGVPWCLVRELRRAAEQFWDAIEELPNDMGWGILTDPNDSNDRLRLVTEAVTDWLDRPWHVLRRWRALRITRKGSLP